MSITGTELRIFFMIMKELPIIVAKTEVGKKVDVKIWRNKREIIKKITLGRLETSEDFKVRGK